jgi:hypothetical protein
MMESSKLSAGVANSKPSAMSSPVPVFPSTRYENLLNCARASLVPARSSAIYEKYFDDFEQWAKEHAKVSIE